MDLFKDLFSKKTKGFSNLSLLKEYAKQYYKQISDINNQLKEKKTQSKREKDNDNLIIKQRSSDFIKANFKEKGLNSLKSYFLTITQEFYKVISNILHKKITEINQEAVISFLQSFYDFDDELVISNSDTIIKVIEGKLHYSLIVFILTNLTYIKACEVVDYLLEKENEMTDIGVKVVSILNIFHKIINFTNQNYSTSKNKADEQFVMFVSKSTSTVLYYFINCLLQLVEEPEMKTVSKLIESNELSQVFSNLSEIKLIRY